jgi:Mannosyl-glycoprotein endo-beta-N-acetylglucosaminidase
MSKNAIHNFNLSIQNSADIKSSEDLTKTIIKELAKVSKEMSQQKDIVQEWQEQQNQNAVTNNSISPTEGGATDTTAEIKETALSIGNTPLVTGETMSNLSVSSGIIPLATKSTSNALIGGGAVDTTGRTTISSVVSDSTTPPTAGAENNTLNFSSGITTQTYASVAAQEMLTVPQALQTNTNEPKTEVVKAEIKKRLEAAMAVNNTVEIAYWRNISKAFDEGATAEDFEGKKDEEYFKQIEKKQLDKIYQTTINNVNWEEVSGLMILKLSELSKERKDVYLKEYYDKLIKKIKNPEINIQQLFLEHDELFLLLKSIFPNLPNKIIINTQKKVYPDLSPQRIYPDIGVEKMYFIWSSPFDILTESIDIEGKEPSDPLHHQFLITTALKIYDAAKLLGATGKGALLIMAQASIESGYGKDAVRRGDYNLFGTSTSGNDYKVKNAQIKIKDYSNVGGYDASIKDYFVRKLKRWTGIADLIKNNDFTGNDIDKAFYTGLYIEDEKTRNKTGHGAYNFDHVQTSKPDGRGTIISNNNKYGEVLMKQMSDFAKRFINSLDYQINKNKKEIINISKKKKSNDNNLNIEPIKDFNDITIELLENENKRLSEIKKDIEN